MNAGIDQPWSLKEDDVSRGLDIFSLLCEMQPRKLFEKSMFANLLTFHDGRRDH